MAIGIIAYLIPRYIYTFKSPGRGLKIDSRACHNVFPVTLFYHYPYLCQVYNYALFLEKYLFEGLEPLLFEEPLFPLPDFSPNLAMNLHIIKRGNIGGKSRR